MRILTKFDEVNRNKNQNQISKRIFVNLTKYTFKRIKALKIKKFSWNETQSIEAAKFSVRLSNSKKVDYKFENRQKISAKQF